MITFTPLDIIGKDERSYTYEYFHERYGRHLLVFRKARSVSGHHYHKGLALSKAPEIIVLVSGMITINWKNIQDAVLQSQTVEAPMKIDIPSYCWHALITLSDSSFIELNSLSDHESDTFYE